MSTIINNEVKVYPSSEGNVWKYVFESSDKIVEAVLYKYESFYKRTVICISTQSGCPVGCAFCGTGKRFIGNLDAFEIINQVVSVLSHQKIEDIRVRGERFQIMFMSMGEPMLNWFQVKTAIYQLNRMYPNAELLLSTVGINDKDVLEDILKVSKEIDKIGLQFSIHKSNDAERNELIPFKNKLTLKQIRDFGIAWWESVGRKPYLNYCVDGENNTDEDSEALMNLFSPVTFNFTFSVVCSKDESMKEAGFKNLDVINEFTDRFLNKGYNVRVFDPAGQDDIGGGCGMLWHVQKYMKEKYK